MIIRPNYYCTNRQISIQALYDYKVNQMDFKIKGQSFQFKHCTIISDRFRTLVITIYIFQFKHCTIISSVRTDRHYLNFVSHFDFNCTIIREYRRICYTVISIQVLYDYKYHHI